MSIFHSIHLCVHYANYRLVRKKKSVVIASQLVPPCLFDLLMVTCYWRDVRKAWEHFQDCGLHQVNLFILILLLMFSFFVVFWGFFLPCIYDISIICGKNPSFKVLSLRTWKFNSYKRMLTPSTITCSCWSVNVNLEKSTRQNLLVQF